MMELDLEDFIEEIKFQMTEYDELQKETILDWEDRFMKWVDLHGSKNKKLTKSGDGFLIKIKNEDLMEEIAGKFYDSYKNQKVDYYWKTFNL